MSDETNNAVLDSLQETGLTSDSENGSTSQEQQAKTYTEKEVEAMKEKIRSDALAEAGRKYKPLEEENTTLKSQLATNQGLIQTNADRIKDLETQIDELSADDPDKKRLTNRLKELEEIETKLKDERKVLDAERLTHADAVKRAQEFALKETTSKVAAEFKNGNAEKLKAACSKHNITNEDDMRALAETFWDKVVVEQEKKPETQITSVDGVTSGGLSDEAFKKAFANYSIPATQENIDRYNRILSS